MKIFVALGVLAFVISADAGPSMHNPHYCYATDPIRSTTLMASIFTSYEAIRRFNFSTVNPNTSTCNASRFWYLGRYGARMPNAQAVQTLIDFAKSSIQEDIVNNYEAGRTTLCHQDYENIRDFTLDSDFGNNLRIENASLVTEAGIIALQNIARRFQGVLPNVLLATYTSAHYHFRHTWSRRTNASIRAFATGLFGVAGAENVVYESVPEIDWFLRPFDFCPLYSEETADGYRQREAFKQGPEIQAMIQQVNDKLGFHASNQMDFDQIMNMWNWCRFEIATTFETSNSKTGGNSPWCAPFSVAHHMLLEYDEDLAFYYTNGYGVRNQRLLQNLNCGLMQDLLRHIQSENDEDKIARIFFAYSQQILGMVVLLGSFRDVWPIHQHNFAQQSDRLWVTSLMVELGSNLSVVRYDCEDGDHDLIFLLNERPILIPGCNQRNGLCKVSVIVNRFQRFIDAHCSTLFCSND